MFNSSEFQESLMILVSTPVYLILIGLEIIFSHFRSVRTYSFPDTVENFYLMLLNMFLDVLLRSFYLTVFIFLFRFQFHHWGYSWLYWLSLLIGLDFMYWLLHYVDHHCRFFWAIHVTHHSSEEFNLTVGFRSSVFQPLYRFLFFAPLSLAGFRPMDILLMYSITQIYGILIHTRLVGKLGFLEYIFATPSNHRVHHGSNIKYLDRNMGMVFIIWDVLFGTFTEEDEQVRYGLTENMTSHRPDHIIFHEWKNIYRDVISTSKIRYKFMYIFGPPGWSHDGRKKTTRQLRMQVHLDKKDIISIGPEELTLN
jgi:sterol desaturase/sphingolipid hydroxylase (fatty acid hydroxylase superfamily)